MVEQNLEAGNIDIAKQTILTVLEGDPSFSKEGVLTARIGELFKKNHPDGKAFKEIFPNENISKFILDYLSDKVRLLKDSNNPIRIYAKSAQYDSNKHESVYLGPLSSKMPKKLEKLRAFLLSLSSDDRAKFEMDGNLILSLLKDES